MNGKILETEEALVTHEEGRYVSAGINGETDRESMADRLRRIEGVKGRTDWRDCISCERCTSCIELRSFARDQRTIQSSLFCMQGEFETSPYKTCNQAHRNRSGRRKVIYDLENAPIGFGTEEQKYVIESEWRRKTKVEETMPEGGYRGGSKYYKRPGGEGEQGVIPSKLMN